MRRSSEYLQAAGFEAVTLLESMPVLVGQIDFLRAFSQKLTVVKASDPPG